MIDYNGGNSETFCWFCTNALLGPDLAMVVYNRWFCKGLIYSDAGHSAPPGPVSGLRYFPYIPAQSFYIEAKELSLAHRRMKLAM